jgi:trimeric autotransporter adhesin
MFRARTASGPRFALALALMGIGFGAKLPPAHAQVAVSGFVCVDSNGVTQGAKATGGTGNFACGKEANAIGANSSNIAIGDGAAANGNNSGNTAIGFGAKADGDRSSNIASGTRAKANGNISTNIATSFEADASGNESGNIASGFRAKANGNLSHNMASGTSADASGDFSNNNANGAGANARGNFARNYASGFLANASGDNSRNIASGNFANASGNNSNHIAIGNGAVATGDNSDSMAIGRNASANFANSAAFGAGATATRANQMAVGTATNTYTTAGITSNASRAAQEGPLQVVTTDAKGNLASDGGALQRQIDSLIGGLQGQINAFADSALAEGGGAYQHYQQQIDAHQQRLDAHQQQIDALGRRDRELADGIAIALAIPAPLFHNGQTVALSFGQGNFDGANAFGLSLAGVLNKGALGPTSSVTLSGGLGVGTTTGTVAGRSSVSFGW